MNILVLGGGGREHALGWRLADKSHRLLFSPGNAGTAAFGQNVQQQQISSLTPDLVVIGPEGPLVEGVADQWRTAGVPVIGPGQDGARLEGSKAFAKQFMEKYGIPTAKHQSFTSYHEALAALADWPMPLVIKADGLAAGKGVVIVHNYDEARLVIKEMMLDAKFGAASETVVLETYLEGVEVSVFVLTDGEDYVILGAAKDYKRIGDGDLGPNTGGMGAISPVSFVDQAMMANIERKIIQPTLNGLQQEGISYIGFLFIGLMIVAGEPNVLEYNVRMGDPETQALLPRIEVDFADLLLATAIGQLGHKTYSLSTRVSATVVCASQGYPDFYRTGFGIEIGEIIPDTYIFHAGTKIEQTKLQTTGGRVLAVTGCGDNLDTALARAYRQVAAIDYEGKYFRTDIGLDLKAIQNCAG